MKQVFSLITLAVLSVSCANTVTQIPVPSTLIAVASNPEPTNWWKDYCQEGALVPYQPECIQSGGLINRVILSNIRTMDGKSIEGTFTIGLPGHNYDPEYQQEMEIQLQAAPPRFREATGIEFIANDWKSTIQEI